MSSPRRLSVLGAVLAGLAAGPAGAGAGVADLPTRPFPARLLVLAQEWSLWPSRTSLPKGAVSVQLLNRGQDPHDLRIQRLGSGGRLLGAAQGVSVTGSGGLTVGLWHLRAGHYLLFCSLPKHRAHGMRTVVVVR